MSMKRSHEITDKNQLLMEELIEGVTPRDMFTDEKGRHTSFRDWPGVVVERTSERCNILFQSID